MLFYLTSLHVSYVLTDSEPIDPYMVDGQNVPTEAQMAYYERGYLDERLFKLSVVTDDNVINNNNAGTSTASMYMIDPSFLWHSSLGHVNLLSMQRIINLGMLPKCSRDKISKCEICVKSKFKSHSHKSVEKSNEILGLIHTDLCDFKATPSRGRKNYSITFIDDYSKFCYVYLINTKDEALNMFKTYKSEVKNQLDKKIKILMFDRGGEYESNDFSEFCYTFGIVHQTTAPYTPQQNGVAERKNRTLKNMINSMLITSGDPHSLWGEACLASNTILNKIPHKKSDKSLYQLWKGKQPSYRRLKVWGCLAKIQIPLLKRTKLGPKTVDYVYLSPAKNSDAYRLLVYKSNVEDISNNTIIESAEAEFIKNIFLYKDKEKQILNPKEIKQRTILRFHKKMLNQEESKIDSIMHNKTWKLVDLPLGHKPIGHKWIFKKKLRPDGTIEKYKARLVAKGDHQKEGQYVFDTYSSVTRITFIRTLIAITAIHNLIIHQMDVKTAFLNGELDEEIYIQQPEGFVVKCQKHKINIKANFVALDKAAEEAERLRSFLDGIPLWPKPVTAVCIHCDNMVALNRAKNHIYNSKSRNIRRRHNTIKDLLRNGIIFIDYVKSKERIADPLTKGLYKEQVIFTLRVEYYRIFLIDITHTRLMCGRIFGNKMAKFSKILMNKDMFTNEMNTTSVSSSKLQIPKPTSTHTLLFSIKAFKVILAHPVRVVSGSVMAHVVSEVVVAAAVVKVEDNNGYISANIVFGYVCSG
uniref:Retrotransposon protein, putative, Ty1-copia subclass n=1 Tax=Tanacetum cinerariifolium TaxID=118510 RepID=A0A6L2KKF9_TANCI|nr:retrotransposon protein, putative, Ty1-copia subclass [Tanacetum cinerariifolium]